MNELSPAANGHALVPQHGIAQATPPADDEGAGGANLLAVAWQSRWLILLGILGGGACSWAYLQQLEPRYTSTARIYVEQEMPKLLAADAGIGGMASKLNTQAELIRSTSVIAAAVETPEIRSLASLRDAGNPVGLVKQALRVNVGNNDDIINISAELPNPEDTAQLVNAVVDAYITKYAERRRTSVVDVLTILRAEKQKRDTELEQRRQAIETYRREHVALAVQTSGETNVVTQLFSALSTELNATQIELLEAKARFNRAKTMLRSPDQLPFLMELARSEHSDQRGGDLENQIQSVEQSLIVERSKWGEGYPAVKLLNDSLQTLRERYRKQQKAIVNAYVDTLRQNFELLVQRRDELQRAYDEQFQLATEVSGQAAQMASLQEAYNRTAKLCDILDDRIKQVNLTEGVGAMNVSILEVAGTGYQTFPMPSKILSTGLAFGAMLGFGLGWLRDFLDHRLKSIEEIASVVQLPIAGAVPLLSGGNAKNADRSIGGRMVALQPRSVAAEAIRTLRTAMYFGVAGADSKVFVVTSPAPGDGKSTIASNLAIAMAQADQRVLLIDADMRKPTQHDIFGMTSRSGLPEVLVGQCPPTEAIVPTEIDSLDLMAGGKRPQNPMDLLTGGLFVEALEQLKGEYDKIVIDSPPVMPVADSRVLAAAADCTLLVLRAERSTKRLSVAARDELLKVRTQRLGVVVNAAPTHRSGYGYGYGGYSGYGGYGAYGQVAYGYGEDAAETPRRVRSSEKSPAANGANGKHSEPVGIGMDS